MSEDEYQKLVEPVRQSVANPMISTDTGVEAVRRWANWRLKKRLNGQ